MSEPTVNAGHLASEPPLLEPADASLLIALLDRAPLPLAVWDDDRQIVDVNAPWVELLGYTADRARGMLVDELIAPESKTGHLMRWSDLLATGAATARIGVLRADGSRIEIRYSAIANVLPGRHLCVFLNRSGGLRRRRTRRGGALTLREQESLRLVAMGLTTSAAAERLGISPETVRTHVRNAMTKLGARTRAQAIAVAIREGEIAS